MDIETEHHIRYDIKSDNQVSYVELASTYMQPEYHQVADKIGRAFKRGIQVVIETLKYMVRLEMGSNKDLGCTFLIVTIRSSIQIGIKLTTNRLVFYLRDSETISYFLD